MGGIQLDRQRHQLKQGGQREKRDAQTDQRCDAHRKTDDQQRPRHAGAERTDRNDRHAQADRTVADRMLNRVTGLMRRHADRCDRGRVIDIRRQADDAGSRVEVVGLKLAFIGSIKDEIFNTEELAAELIGFLNEYYPGILEEKYHVDSAADVYIMLGQIAESRHCLIRGNELDTEKAAVLLLDDFRNGRLGRLTLEYPQEV